MNQSPSSTSRLVRVLINSTFRDLMWEWDELVQKVFPDQRRRNKGRFVELLEVNLQWGITAEQSKQANHSASFCERLTIVTPLASRFSTPNSL